MVLNSSFNEANQSNHLSSIYHVNAQLDPPIYEQLPRAAKESEDSEVFLVFFLLFYHLQFFTQVIRNIK